MALQISSIATFKKTDRTEALLKSLGFKATAIATTVEGNRIFEKTLYKFDQETVSIAHEKGTLPSRHLDPIITLHTSHSIAKLVKESLE